MKPVVRNILAIVAGIALGSIVNMAIIMISSKIIPPPSGSDITTMEGLKESMHLFTPKNFIMPFLAHAMGTLVGAFVATKMAVTNKLTLSLAIGVLFLIGGIQMVLQLPSPIWFTLLDIIVAYIPMAYLGWKLGSNK